MRYSLVELKPEWIRGASGGRVGIAFLCPEHGDHQLRIFFALPPDGDNPISMGSAGIETVFHTGNDLDSLSIGRGIDHGEVLVFIQHGEVITG